MVSSGHTSDSNDLRYVRSSFSSSAMMALYTMLRHLDDGLYSMRIIRFQNELPFIPVKQRDALPHVCNADSSRIVSAETIACVLHLDPYEVVFFHDLYNDLSALNCRLEPMFYRILYKRLKQHGWQWIFSECIRKLDAEAEPFTHPDILNIEIGFDDVHFLVEGGGGRERSR